MSLPTLQGVRSSGGSINPANVQLPLPTIDGHCHMFGQSLSVGEAFHPQSKVGKVVIVPKAGGAPIEYPADVLIYSTHEYRSRDDAGEYEVGHIMTSRSVVEIGASNWPPRATTKRPREANADVTHVFDAGRDFRIVSRGLGKNANHILATQAARHDKFGGYFLGNDGANAKVCIDGIPSTSGARATVPLLLDLGYTPLEVDVDGVGLAGIGTRVISLPPAAGDKDGYYDDGGSKTWVWFDRRAFEYTIEALGDVAAKYPGNVWPMVPYDPRRAADKNDPHASDPLYYVKTAIDKFGFVGVKLYSRCGWMPTNNRIIHGVNGPKLDDAMEKLYAYAEANEVPLLNHTSPTGFPPNIVSYTRSALILPKKYALQAWNAGELGPPGWPQAAIDDAKRTDGSPTAKFDRFCRTWARAGCDRAARYCHYDQHTVSPYMWEPVLQKHPNLRLNLAHWGSQLSWLTGIPSLQTSFFKTSLERPYHELNENPMVAGADLFGPLFEECCRITAADMVIRTLNSVVGLGHAFAGWSESVITEGLSYTPEIGGSTGHGVSFGLFPRVAVPTYDVDYKSIDEITARVKELVPEVLRESQWQKWVADWKAKFPDGWYKKIKQLIGRYANVYADFAYFSGEDSTNFVNTLREFIKEVRADGVMADKSIMGTDWFMTEMDKMDPGEFWNRFTQVVPVGKDPLWEKLTTTNCLKFLHLKPRLDKMEAWYKQRNANYQPKTWWPQLRKFYGLDPGAKPAPPKAENM